MPTKKKRINIIPDNLPAVRKTTFVVFPTPSEIVGVNGQGKGRHPIGQAPESTLRLFTSRPPR